MRVAQQINDGWQFRKDGPGQEFEEVNLPHTYNAVDGQDGSPMYRGPVVYKKKIHVDLLPHKVHYLEVGAASLASPGDGGLLFLRRSLPRRETDYGRPAAF